MVNYINDLQQRFTEEGSCYFFRQIVEGIYYLHQVGLCHR